MTSSLESPAISIDGLTKDFPTTFLRKPVRAVENLHLTVGRGEVYGLIGPNGSGKSTTMKVLLGLFAPSAGTCRVFGQNPHLSNVRHSMGYLPENPYFYKHLSGVETLSFYGKLCGMKGRLLKERVEALLEEVSLSHASKRRVGTYSKGMLQRLGLATALMSSPQLLILDEPTAGVDPEGSILMRRLIADLKAQGVTIFLCSHLLDQVQEICDQVGILCQGKMLRSGRVEELIAIDNQMEIIIENASERTLALLEACLADDPKARLISMRHPKTSLEHLFLESTQGKHQPS